MSRKHAKLSPSAANRWLTCTKSAQLEESFENTESSHAAEGTLAHDLAELLTRSELGELSKRTVAQRMSKIKKSEYYDAEMLEYCQGYADFIVDTLRTATELCPDAFVELESKLDLSEYVPGGFGHSDAIIIADEVLEVIDFKYGRGVLVESELNAQMMLYALGAYNKYKDLYDIEIIKMTVYQPRIQRSPNSYEMKLEELLDWAETYVKPRAELADKGEGEYCPTPDACKFCRAKHICRARAEENLKAFDAIGDPDLLSLEEACEILQRTKDLKTWITDIETYVTAELYKGVPAPGFKLVAGRSLRKWMSDQAVIDELEANGLDTSEFTETKLLSVAQLEKRFGKSEVERMVGAMIDKPVGKPTLAPIDDKRPAYTPQENILDAFDNA